MLRALVVALAAANLLWFAWAQGWLEGWLPPPGDAEQREPHRLDSQQRPQAVTVTPLREGAMASRPDMEAAPQPATEAAPQGAPTAAPRRGGASAPGEAEPASAPSDAAAGPGAG